MAVDLELPERPRRKPVIVVAVEDDASSCCRYRSCRAALRAASLARCPATRRVAESRWSSSSRRRRARDLDCKLVVSTSTSTTRTPSSVGMLRHPLGAHENVLISWSPASSSSSSFRRERAATRRLPDGRRHLHEPRARARALASGSCSLGMPDHFVEMTPGRHATSRAGPRELDHSQPRVLSRDRRRDESTYGAGRSRGRQQQPGSDREGLLSRDLFQRCRPTPPSRWPGRPRSSRRAISTAPEARPSGPSLRPGPRSASTESTRYRS